jgi:ribosomal protein S18 acetylase RimI-like enzyme
MFGVRKGVMGDKHDYLSTQFSVFPNEMDQRERHEKCFEARVNSGGFLALEASGKYVGHVTFSNMIFPPFSNSIYIEELAILDDFRKGGGGRMLIDATKDECKNAGYHEIWLDTWASKRNKAIPFFKKMGFEKKGCLSHDKIRIYFFSFKI